YNVTDAAAICDGETYVFGTQTLTASGTYTEVFTTVDGCDSTVTLTLTVYPVYNVTDAAAICDGETYVFGTQTLTASGTYTEVFTTVDGCDSTVTLTLTVYPVYNTTDAAAICDGETYVFGTQTLTASGTYTEVFTTVDGCDSTVTLTLTVYPVYNTTDAAAICDGDTYVFGTQTLTASGTYTEVFTTVDGCDSTVILTLTVNPLPVSSLAPLYTMLPGASALLDAGAGFATYYWNTGSTDQTIQVTAPGSFNVEITDVNSCSIVASTVVEYNLDTIHNVTIMQGWSYFSTFVTPYNDSIPDVFSPVINSIIMVKNSDGESYWPFFNLNLIGDYVVGEGYQVNSTDTVICPIPGEIILPELTPIVVPAGWSYIGYLRISPGNAVDMVSTIYSNVLLLKDENGNSVWPFFNLNLIGDLLPGDGYQVLLSVEDTLVYPANSGSTKVSGILVPEPKHFEKAINTGSNMTLGIPLSAWDKQPAYGDEIAVITASGNVIGSSVFTGAHVAISIWGDDIHSDKTENIKQGESFTVLVWNSFSNSESLMEISSWTEGNQYFKENQVSIVGNIQKKKLQVVESVSSSYFPNPFNDVATIEFVIPDAGKVRINLIDNNGKTVDIICDNDFTAGKHTVSYSNANLAPGIYYYKLIHNDEVVVNKMIKE
ncbi:MAG: T9SS type A sorting domain-containing protein, partial [Bacteroidota bacterium]|nr:T9SS type A sorting domain-containing protein [Bacteroidota bacterium]